MKKFNKLVIIAMLAMMGGYVQAQKLEIIPIDDPVPLAAAQAPDVWYIDRYAPSVFAMDVFNAENVLKHSIDGVGDGSANRPGGQQGTFYNTQGRKYDLGVGVTKLYADLYLPESFETAHRRAGLWGTAYDAAGLISAYPILSFRNVDAVSPKFSYYSSNLGDWVDIVYTIDYDEWYSLEIVMDSYNEEYRFYINGDLVGTDDLSYNGCVYFGNMILQAYNFNDPALPGPQQSSDSYDVYWDNVGSLSTIHNITADTYHGTLQDAINQATAGDEIEMGNNRYPVTSTIDVNKSVTITGESMAGVILDASGMTPITNRVIETDGDDITLTNLTIIPITDPNPAANNNMGYTIKAGSNSVPDIDANLILENITIDGAAERTPFDFHGIDGVTATNLFASGTTRGNGIQFTGCTDVTLDGFTGTGNAWGSIAIYASRVVPVDGRGSDNVTIDGTLLSIDGAVYSQDDFTAPGGPLYNTNISVTGWDYLVFNDDHRAGTEGEEYTFYTEDYAAATALGEFLNTLEGGNTASAIQKVSDGEWYVPASLTIQAAIDEADPGDIINVDDGTYQEGLNLTKSITLYGANKDESPNTGSRGAESIIAPQGANNHALEGSTDITVVIQGFTIDMSGATGDARFAHYTSGGTNSWTLENNILTNGIGVINGDIWFSGSQTLTFNLWDNHMFGNGVSNGFSLWGSNTNTIDIQDNVWEDNAGWALNLNRASGTIANNTFKDNSVTGPNWYDDQNGIIFATDGNNVTLTGNTFDNLSIIAVNIYDNFDGTLTATGNTFTNIGVNNVDNSVDPKAVSVRESGGNTGDLTDVSFNDNSFINNELGINNPSTTQTFDATCNWWGTTDPVAIEAANNGDVNWSPFNSTPAGPCDGEAPVMNITQNTLHGSIQSAVDAANPGDQLDVIDGTFTEQVVINKANLIIHGNNDGICAGVDPGARNAETILDGGFYIQGGGAGTTIDGFTIINGYTTGGHQTGIVVTPDDVNIENCIITDCVGAQAQAIETVGGADNLTITCNEITDNWRGIYLNPADGGSITDNNIHANNGVGVGIGSDGQSNLNIDHNYITDHTLEGWGISAVGANVSAEHNRFENNGTSLAHYGGSAVTASCNWWGSANAGVVAASVSGNVIYDPWLATNNIDVPVCTGTNCAVAAPTGFTVVNDMVSGTATITWNAVNGASSYDILINTGNGFTVINVPTNSYVVTGLTLNQLIQYRVRSVCVNGSNSPYSALQFFTFTIPCITTPPTGMAWANQNYIGLTTDLDWNITPDAVSYDVTYQINGGPLQTVNGLGANHYVLGGLAFGDVVTWSVRSNCPGGYSSAYAAGPGFTFGTICTNSTPENLATANENAGAGTIDLSWDAVTGATGYEIEYTVNNGAPSQITGIATNMYTLGGLTDGDYVTWKVRSVCEQGALSEYSDEDDFFFVTECAVTPPINLDAPYADFNLPVSGPNPKGSALLTWDPVPGAINYHIFSNIGNYVPNATGGAAEYTLNNIPLGANVEWYVKAVCLIGGESDWSAANMFTFNYNPACNVNPPSNLDAPEVDWDLPVVNPAVGSAELTWDPVPGAISYDVWTNLAGYVGNIGNVTSYTLNNIPLGYQVQWYVRAVCLIGGKSAYSGPGIFTFNYNPACNVNPPSNLEVSDQGGGVVLLEWDAVPGATDYQLWSAATGFISSTFGFTDYVFSGYSNGDMVTLYVRSVCLVGGVSAYSSISFEYGNIGSRPVFVEIGAVSNEDMDELIQSTEGDQLPETNARLQVFPNPYNGNGYLTIQLSDDQAIETVTLFDMQGQPVPVNVSRLQSTQSELTLRNQLSAGMYMLRVTSDQHVYTTPIVIQ